MSRLDRFRRAEEAVPQCDEIQERFLKFHADNPHVYTELLKLAKRARNKGTTASESSFSSVSVVGSG